MQYSALDCSVLAAEGRRQCGQWESRLQIWERRSWWSKMTMEPFRTPMTEPHPVQNRPPRTCLPGLKPSKNEWFGENVENFGIWEGRPCAYSFRLRVYDLRKEREKVRGRVRKKVRARGRGKQKRQAEKKQSRAQKGAKERGVERGGAQRALMAERVWGERDRRESKAARTQGRLSGNAHLRGQTLGHLAKRAWHSERAVEMQRYSLGMLLKRMCPRPSPVRRAALTPWGHPLFAKRRRRRRSSGE